MQVKLEQFGGQFPAWDANLLPTGQAAFAKNCYLFSGALTGWRVPKVLRALNNPSARMAFRIPTVTQTQARAYLVFVTQPSPGDQVIVGDLTYTFVASLVPVSTGTGNPQDVLIGANSSITGVNFAAALTADNNLNTNAGILYGSQTASNGDVLFYLPNTNPIAGKVAPTEFDITITGTSYATVTVGATDFGASFNLVNVSETTGGTRLTWLSDLAALSHTTTALAGGSNPVFDPSITGAATWLEFIDPDTNVVKSPIVDDQFNRFYFASPSQMPQYNTYNQIVAAKPPWLLGVPPPGCAPTLAVSGGGNSMTLGNVLQSGPDAELLGNTVYLVPFTTTGATVIQDVQFNLSTVDPGDTTTQYAAVVYQDNLGKPGTLLDTGAIVTGVNPTGNISAFVNPIGLNTQTQYWLGIISNTQHAVQGGAIPGVSFAATFTNGPPGTAPAAAAAAGLQVWGDFLTSDIIEARAYAYTWVSAYGEEGPPSPPTLLNGWSNGTWTLGLWAPPPDDLGVLRNLQSINVYRTVPGQGGATVFFFVATMPIGTATFVDNIPDSTVALNNQLASTNWFPPPANLQGLTVMQNGMVAGFIGNEIWFCEPYRPHAWPPGYVLTVDYTIIGLGFTNGSLVVCTASHPFVITGNTPSQLSQMKCAQPNPCLSRASILNGDGAVSYMSPNGLIQVTAAGAATNTTDLWFTREKWQQLTPQKYTRAIFLASCYYCMGSVSPPSVSISDNSVAQTGFTIELDQDNASFTIWPQPGGHRLGFNQLSSASGFDVQNLMTDTWTGIGLMISNGSVYYFDFTDPASVMVPYTWRSKTYQQNVKRSFSAMKAFFQSPPGTPAQGAFPNTAAASDPSWNTLGPNQLGIIRTFVDVDGTGNLVLIDAREIRTSGALLRVVDGFKADNWAWEITARVVISNIQIAPSVKELGGA